MIWWAKELCGPSWMHLRQTGSSQRLQKNLQICESWGARGRAFGVGAGVSSVIICYWLGSFFWVLWMVGPWSRQTLWVWVWVCCSSCSISE